MSLEAAIQENTAAIRELIEKFAHIGAAVQREASYDADNKAREQLQAQRDAKAPKQEKLTPDEKPRQVTYEDIKNAGLKLIGTKGKDALTEVLARHGLTTAKDAKPEQFTELYSDIQKAIG